MLDPSTFLGCRWVSQVWKLHISGSIQKKMVHSIDTKIGPWPVAISPQEGPDGFDWRVRIPASRSRHGHVEKCRASVGDPVSKGKPVYRFFCMSFGFQTVSWFFWLIWIRLASFLYTERKTGAPFLILLVDKPWNNTLQASIRRHPSHVSPCLAQDFCTDIDLLPRKNISCPICWHETSPVGHLASPILRFWAPWTCLGNDNEGNEVCALGDVCRGQKHGGFQPTRKSGPVWCSWISEFPGHTGVSGRMMVWPFTGSIWELINETMIHKNRIDMEWYWYELRAMWVPRNSTFFFCVSKQFLSFPDLDKEEIIDFRWILPLASGNQRWAMENPALFKDFPWFPIKIYEKTLHVSGGFLKANMANSPPVESSCPIGFPPGGAWDGAGTRSS